MATSAACHDCTEARTRTWCGYRIGCAGCSARAAARSLAAFNALHPRGNGEREPLRDLIRQLLPETPFEEGRSLVWAWWKADHPGETA